MANVKNKTKVRCICSALVPGVEALARALYKNGNEGGHMPSCPRHVTSPKETSQLIAAMTEDIVFCRKAYDMMGVPSNLAEALIAKGWRK